MIAWIAYMELQQDMEFVVIVTADILNGKEVKIMRLIDVDALIERKFMIYDTEDLTDEEFENLVNTQPTAYDIEKVVAELESRKELLNMAKISTIQKNVGQNAYNIAIGIVKAGGKEVNEN